MKIKNVKVYGLEESIIRSGYPMQTGEPADLEFESENLSYWMENGLKEVLDRLNYIPLESKKTEIEYHRKTLNEIKEVNETYSIINLRDNEGNITGELIIDNIDLKTILPMKWNMASTGYAMSCNNGLCHRLILNPEEDQLIDHINNNKLDNRRENLRIASVIENLRNKRIVKNNSSGIIGVSYKKDKLQWKAYLTVAYKQIHLGYFELFEDAVKSRLEGELSYFKQYSPQIDLLEEYGIINPYKDLYVTTYKYNLKSALKNYKRILSLGKSKTGSGHDCALRGIIVQFDLQYPEYFSPQLQRYHWIDIVSSQSKMHKLTSRELTVNDFTKQTWTGAIDHCNLLIRYYNSTTLEEQKDLTFNELISVLPSGYLKWMGISTNYLQLKTIYNQRNSHKLVEWREFCNWIESLPMAKELILTK